MAVFDEHLQDFGYSEEQRQEVAEKCALSCGECEIACEDNPDFTDPYGRGCSAFPMGQACTEENYGQYGYTDGSHHAFHF